MMQDKKYCYDFPRPAVTTDCIIFGFSEGELRVLLIKRNLDPFKGRWAFPGGFLEMEENADEGARRELLEETGIRDCFIEQLHTFTRVDRDPRGRTISIVYYAMTRQSDLKPEAGDDAGEVQWFSIKEVPPLAFDHDQVLSIALDRIHDRFSKKITGFEMLPEKFTLPEMQKLYESVLRKKLDRRNFRKRMLGSGILNVLEIKEKGKPHRGAVFYSLNKARYKEYTERE